MSHKYFAPFDKANYLIDQWKLKERIRSNSNTGKWILLRGGIVFSENRSGRNLFKINGISGGGKIAY
jgi:hypothetical protein